MLSRVAHVSRLALTGIVGRPSYPMSDRWKEREDAAENMYISQKESK